MIWHVSHRFDPRGCEIADRHYNRQKIGSPQFVPPGRCLVLIAETETGRALWVTSWPLYARHAWRGAWVNTLFRSEAAGHLASKLILQALAATISFYKIPPSLGMITFVDPAKVPGVKVRGETIYGFSYMKAGFTRVEDTKGGLWTWQMLPDQMPAPELAFGMSEGFEEIAR